MSMPEFQIARPVILSSVELPDQARLCNDRIAIIVRVIACSLANGPDRDREIAPTEGIMFYEGGERI
jgi:hypothetical protein